MPANSSNNSQQEGFKENYMADFKEVTVVRKANVYFDGRVTSRTIILKDGSRKTLGVMLPGEYEFGTAEKEVMEIQSGEVEVQLPGSPEWRTFTGGQSFDVPADSKFRLKVGKLVDYCCSFIK
jgi:purine/pyrimidine-nucleoside phosphorylase